MPFTVPEYRRRSDQQERQTTRRSFNTPRARSANQQTSVQELIKNLGGYGTPIPIVYGEAEIGGIPFIVDYQNGTWTVAYALCLGDIESVDKVFLNDDLAEDGGVQQISGVSVNHYLGDQSVGYTDPLLDGALDPGFTDSMHIAAVSGLLGVAYVVVQYSNEKYNDWPRCTARLKGKKVHVPGTSTLNDPSTYVFTETPAYHLADLLANTDYGGGHTLDWVSVSSVASDNEATVGGEPRRANYSVIDQPRELEDWVEVLRLYASCFVVKRADEHILISDRPASSVMTITEDNIIRGTMDVERRSTRDTPTIIRAMYTDTTEDIWRERLCDPAQLTGVDTGATPWREQQIRLTGIKTHEQAYRECVERLNKLTQNDLTVEFSMNEVGVQLEAGDVITVNHPYWGGVNKELRLVEDPVERSGYVSIIAQEYNLNMYSDEVQAPTTGNDGSLPNGGVPSAPDTITVTPLTDQYEDGRWFSYFKIEWTPPADDSLVSHYIVEIRRGVEPVWDTVVGLTQLETATGPLREETNYDIQVYAVNTALVGPPKVASAETLPANSSTLPNTPSGLSAQVREGMVTLSWTAEPGVPYYHIKEGANGASWAASTTVDDKRAATTIAIRVADGNLGTTRRFHVKAVDELGNESNSSDNFDILVPALSAGGSGPTIFYNNTPPTPNAIGDLWYDLDDKNHPHRATGLTSGDWDSIRDGTIQDAQDTATSAAQDAQDALDDAQAAQATADGKIITWFGTTNPTTLLEWEGSPNNDGDIWFDTNGGDLIPKRWDGSWVLVHDSTIADAQGDADAAIGQAAIANAAIADIADDDILSVVEKGQVVLQVDTIHAEDAGIIAEADSYGVSRTAYVNAISALDSYLATLTSPVLWSNMSDETDLTDAGSTGPAFRQKFEDVYTERQGVLDGIAAEAKILADAAQGTANLKVQTFYQATAPTVGGDDVSAGDLWVDTSGDDSNGNSQVWKRRNDTNTGWVSMFDEDDIVVAEAAADGKSTNYYSPSAPSPLDPAGSQYDKGDQWFHEISAGLVDIYVCDDTFANNGKWVKEQDSELKPLMDITHVNVVQTIQANDFDAVAMNRYGLDTETNGAFEMELPNLGGTPANFHMVKVEWFDAQGYFDVQPVTIVRNPTNPIDIMELSEDLICDVRYFSGGLIYVHPIGWQLI